MNKEKGEEEEEAKKRKSHQEAGGEGDVRDRDSKRQRVELNWKKD